MYFVAQNKVVAEVCIVTALNVYSSLSVMKVQKILFLDSLLSSMSTFFQGNFPSIQKVFHNAPPLYLKQAQHPVFLVPLIY